MASGLKSRVIFKEHGTDGNWVGTYKLVGRPKSIPSPVGERNLIDVSTLEDLQEVQEFGRRSATSIVMECAYDKDYCDELMALSGKKLDIIHLYGTEGLGSIGKWAYIGSVDVAPNEATNEHLTMSVKIAVGTEPILITDEIKVTETTTGGKTTFAVANAS